MITALIVFLFLTSSFGALMLGDADQSDTFSINFGFWVWFIFGVAMIGAIFAR